MLSHDEERAARRLATTKLVVILFGLVFAIVAFFPAQQGQPVVAASGVANSSVPAEQKDRTNLQEQHLKQGLGSQDVAQAALQAATPMRPEAETEMPASSKVTVQPDGDGPLNKTMTIADEKALIRIPANTVLDVLEKKALQQGKVRIWFYRVAYKNKEGWLNEHFTTSSSGPPTLGVNVFPELEDIGATGDRMKADLKKKLEKVEKESKASVVDAVAVNSLDGKEWKATFRVENVWHTLPYQARLQLAQSFQELWASIVNPDDPDLARISLTDLKGNEVGGSRWLGGSEIWVQEK